MKRMKPGMSLIKHYLQFKDLRAEEYVYLFERTATIKKRFKNYEKYTPLVDRTLAMIFERPRRAPASASRPACTRWAARS
jgi:ornithine carbamoyltransferase